MPTRQWTNEQLTEAVKNSYSIAQVLRKLDLTVAGGNYHNIQKNISKLNLDIAHFKGKGWSKGSFGPLYKLKSPISLKRGLINIRGHKCEMCNNEQWNGKPIPLELEHIDGNKYNNVEANLKLLCCNCHATTPTWRRNKSSLK